MKQLIEIDAKHVQKGDFIFSPKSRELLKVLDFYLKDEEHDVFISFDKAEKYHRFSASFKVHILVDTEKLRSVDNTLEVDAVIELGKGQSL